MEQLPLWFLLLAILLPRVSLVLAYFVDDLLAFGLHGFVPPALAVILPRVLVLILIFQDRGFSLWLIVHGIAAAVVYFSAGSNASN